ncbi:hypothetical protein PAPHI01_0048 [Pancytospora philotis]|nr:hypothetical protein PAPHI01_0048 [Pancytospora philotis]
MDLVDVKLRLTKAPAKIDDIEFYVETIRIVKEYLGASCAEPAAAALQNFVRVCNAQREPGSAANTDLGSIRGGMFETTALGNAFSRRSDEAFVPYAARRRVFIEELRHALLRLLIKDKPVYKATAVNYHVYVHLLELHYFDELSLHEKMSEFLNVNFKLREDDFTGHARRGNFGELARIRPTLLPAIEELLAILADAGYYGVARGTLFSAQQTGAGVDSRLEAWRAKHEIESALYTVLSGRCKNFPNQIEECCYDLAYRKPLRSTNLYLNALQGRFDELLAKARGWLRLVTMLALGHAAELREYETLFELLYEEVAEMDHHVGLDFLAFSRSCAYHFNILVSSAPLNSLNVELFINFAERNGIAHDHILSKYAHKLRNEGRLHDLCAFIVAHSVQGILYDRALAVFFVKHFARYAAFVEDKFASDASNRFVALMHTVQEADSEALAFLIESEHADWYLGEIVSAVVESSCANDLLLAKCLTRVVQCSDPAAATAIPILKRKLLQRLALAADPNNNLSTSASE